MFSMGPKERLNITLHTLHVLHLEPKHHSLRVKLHTAS